MKHISKDQKELLASGIHFITFTLAWYSDETDLWDGPNYFDKDLKPVFGQTFAEVENELYDELYTSDGGEYKWDVRTGKVEHLRSAYVSEPELYYGD